MSEKSVSTIFKVMVRTLLAELNTLKKLNDVVELSPENCYSKLNATLGSEDMDQPEKNLIDWWLYFRGVSTFYATDQAVTGYAYSIELNDWLIRTSSEYNAISDIIKKLLYFTILERTGKWGQEINISKDYKILFGY